MCKKHFNATNEIIRQLMRPEVCLKFLVNLKMNACKQATKQK